MLSPGGARLVQQAWPTLRLPVFTLEDLARRHLIRDQLARPMTGLVESDVFIAAKHP